ncbi:MAG: UpxY family transcription antiterminator [Bacteroidota bacterium]
MKATNQWYAVYTRPRWEKKASELLSKRQIENYCPLNKVVRKWSDRKKIIYEPLFTSYVFINAEEKELSTIKQTDGVLNFVYWLGKPAVIKDDEINTIKNFLNEYQNVKLEQTEVNIYDTVRINSGPFMQREGDVMEVKNKSVKIYLPSLGYAMVAEVEKSNVEIISKADMDAKSTSLAYGYLKAI